jgi:hypothetical protein
MLYRLRSIDKILLYRYQEINLAILLSIVVLLCACQTNASRIEETKKNPTSGVGILRPAAEPLPTKVSNISTTTITRSKETNGDKQTTATRALDTTSRVEKPANNSQSKHAEQYVGYKESRGKNVNTNTRRSAKTISYETSDMESLVWSPKSVLIEKCQSLSRKNDEDCVRLRSGYDVLAGGAVIKPSTAPKVTNEPCTGNCPKSNTSETNTKAEP